MVPDKKHLVFLRVYVVYVALLLFAACIVGRIIFLVFVEGDKWSQMAKKQSFRVETVKAIRGNIYSCDGSLIATSVPRFTIRMDLHPNVVSNDTILRYLKPLSDSLAKMFPKKNGSEYFKILQQARAKKKRGVLLAKDLTYSEYQRIKQFPILRKGPNKGGLIVEENDKRSLPYRLLAERTIGYEKDVSKNRNGVGIEAAFDTELGGISGQRLTKRVTTGVWRPISSGNQIDPQNGKDVYTTIDIRIQDVAEAALMRCLEDNEAEFGCAILMEVATGEVRAIANLKRESNGRYTESLNYAIGTSTEPGSTFKLASAIAILEESPDTSVLVPTGIKIFHGSRMIDSRREGYGDISFKNSFEKSSNVGISHLTYELFHKNPRKFTDYLYKMGLNQKLGIELEGEGIPKIKNPKDKTWWKTSLPWMSIGYEVTMTPLQQLALYNAVANDGTMVKPYFVRQIKEGNELIRENKPEVLVEQICSKKTLGLIRSMLEGVVQNGTAKSLSKSPYTIAGKTGTAQANYAKKGTEKMEYRASFAGYFPADKPKFSCIVIIYNPQKGKIYGGELSAPVFKEIADKVYATLLKDYVGKEIPKETTSPYPLRGGGWAGDIQKVYTYMKLPPPALSANYAKLEITPDKKGEYRSINLEKDVMPNVTGLGVRDAMYLLERNGLKVQVYGKGFVAKQSIAPGSAVNKGAYVQLELRN